MDLSAYPTRFRKIGFVNKGNGAKAVKAETFSVFSQQFATKLGFKVIRTIMSDFDYPPDVKPLGDFPKVIEDHS